MSSTTTRQIQVYFDETPSLPRWLVVGASRIVESHFLPTIRAIYRAHHRHQEADGSAHALYSRSLQHASRLANRHAIPFVNDNLRALLDDPRAQIVYVASHPRNHAEQVAAALRAGKHVLCEAPLALDPAEAETLVEMAANRSLKLGIGRTVRGIAELRRARQIVVSEELGELLSLEISNLTYLPLSQQTWRLQPNGGGVAFERTLQSLDALTFLLDDQVSAVSARSGQQILGNDADVFEELFTLARLQRHPFRAQIHDALHVPHGDERIALHGSRGSLVIHGWSGRGRGTVELTKKGRVDAIALPSASESWTANAYMRCVGQMWASVGGGLTPLLDAKTHVEHLHVQHMIEQAARSERDQIRRPKYIF
jgi:1,5-anhydro-D-fructose reductase (1,5-anhydro-D-mannitol-forming)